MTTIASTLDLVVTVGGTEPAAYLLVEFETEIFQAQGFGDTHVYDHVLAQSRFIAGYIDGVLVGLARVVDSGEHDQPFVNAFPEVKANETFQRARRHGSIEEVATVAVRSGHRVGHITFDLIRHIHSQGLLRGATHQAWIIEPSRARQLDRRFGLASEQISNVAYYMGGYCAVFIADIRNDAIYLKQEGGRREWYLGAADSPLRSLTLSAERALGTAP